MNIEAIATANTISVALMVILLFIYGSAPRRRALDERLFRSMVLITILQSVMETLTFLLDGRRFWGALVLTRVLNSGLFAASALLSWLWVVYVDYAIYHSRRRLQRICLPLFVPAALNILGSLVNLFVPVFYEISPENVYSRTALSPVSYFVVYLYMLYSLWMAHRAHRRAGQTGRYILRAVLIFLLPIFIGSSIQMLCYGLSLIWVSIAVGLVALYGTLQNEAVYIDPLSQLYNRQYLNRNLERLIYRGDQQKMAGIMVDIDDFKSINDRFGHIIGDQAILETANILRAATDPDDIVARYAGDEFVILTQVEDEAELQRKAQRLLQTAEAYNEAGGRPYQIHFSLGCHLMQNETPESFLDTIDAAMYQQKRRSKAKNKDSAKEK